MFKNLDKLRNYSSVFLRVSISFLFLWFGASQLSDPSFWTSFVPSFVTDLSFVPSAQTLVIFNGIFEIIFGLLLLIGLFTRLSAGLLALHLFGIALSIGYNPLGIRDFVLALATASVFLAGPDPWCLDMKWRSK